MITCKKCKKKFKNLKGLKIHDYYMHQEKRKTKKKSGRKKKEIGRFQTIAIPVTLKIRIDTESLGIVQE